MCEFSTKVACQQHNGDSCDDLASPAEITCIGSTAEELSFIYVPSSQCSGNNAQDSFSCTDFNLDRPFEVHLKFVDNSKTLYEGVVSGGELFAVNIPSDSSSVLITISTVSSTGGIGTILQISSMSVRCRNEDKLNLLDTFGSLQLTGFKNAEMGNQQVFANVDITYTATNSGLYDASLLQATVTSPFSGRHDTLPESEIRFTAPNDSETFTESFLLNLAEVSGSFYEFDFAVQGEGTQSGLPCSEDTTFSLQVQ